MNIIMPTDNTYKGIIKITFPIFIGLLTQNLMGIIDTVFLGRVDDVSLAAGGIGSLFYVCFTILGLGLSIGSQIVIGRRNGEKSYTEIGLLFNQILYICIGLGLFSFLFIQCCSDSILLYMVSSPEILENSLLFIKTRSYFIIFTYLNFLYVSFYIGTTNTKVLLLSNIISTIVNIICAYALVLGHYGYNSLGIKGAAIATNIAETVGVVILSLYSIISGLSTKYKLRYLSRIDFNRLLLLLKISFPLMLQNFVALVAWFIFFIIIEKSGIEALAVSNIIRSIYLLLMIPVWALSSTSNSLISNLLGEGRINEVIVTLFRLVKVAFVIIFIIVLVVYYFKYEVLRIFTNEISLINNSILVINVILVALLVFSVSAMLSTIISGTGNTLVLLKIDVFILSLYLIYSYILGIVLRCDVHIIWTSEIFYFVILGLLSYLFIRNGKWKEFSKV